MTKFIRNRNSDKNSGSDGSDFCSRLSTSGLPVSNGSAIADFPKNSSVEFYSELLGDSFTLSSKQASQLEEHGHFVIAVEDLKSLMTNKDPQKALQLALCIYNSFPNAEITIHPRQDTDKFEIRPFEIVEVESLNWDGIDFDELAKVCFEKLHHHTNLHGVNLAPHTDDLTARTINRMLGYKKFAASLLVQDNDRIRNDFIKIYHEFVPNKIAGAEALYMYDRLPVLHGMKASRLALRLTPAMARELLKNHDEFNPRRDYGL